MTIDIEDMKAYSTIQTIIRSVGEDWENTVISLHQELHIRMAMLHVERGFLEEVDTRSTDDPNERCFKLTAVGKQNLEVTGG